MNPSVSCPRKRASRRRSVCRWLVGVALLNAIACAAPPLREDPWVVARSPSFEVLSAMDSDTTKSLLESLERFRALIYAVTNAPALDPPIPTHIYAFGDRKDYLRFAPGKSAGSFVPGLRANLIMLYDYNVHIPASEIILHEYVHFILRNGEQKRYPVWYDEGFADFMSTAREEDGTMVIGDAPVSRVHSLRQGQWLALGDVVSASAYSDVAEDDRHMLYAQSWALIHYLTLDREDGSMPREMGVYMRALQEGATPAGAFARAFGETVEEADRSVQSLLRKGKINRVGLPISKLDYDSSPPSMRRADPQEVAVRLGQLWLTRGKAEAAEREFRAAIEIDPGDARAQAGLGDAFKFQGRLAAAAAYFERAVVLDPSDPLNHLDLGEYLHDLAREERSESRRRDLLERARRAYEQTLALSAESPEAWLMLGRTYLEVGEDPEQGLAAIERAMEILPSSPQVYSSLAEAYVASGRLDQARRLLTRYSAARSRGSLATNIDGTIDAIRSARAEAAKKLESTNGEATLESADP